ncbi:MAG: hypothetical protein D6773_11225 [Alphaproteobacteria bacterium]|nr:MAG: hypothetical protein D6773_11225 [Alphaproteobacteria bacterium]
MAERPRISAGEAFARSLQNDPATRAAWKRTSARLRVIGEIWSRIRTASADERQHAARELTETIQEALRASGDELAAAGFEPPQTIEDWEHLALIAEMPFEKIRSGDFTLAEVRAVALAWADRQRMKAMLAGEGRAPQPGRQVTPDDDDQPPPALTANEVAVLRTLASIDPAELASVARVEAAMDRAQRVSEKTIRLAIRRLVGLGLAERPEGDRRGARLTIAGRRLVRKITD